MPWRRSFEAFVEATNAATSVDRLFEIMLDAMQAFGFDFLNFSIQRDAELHEAHKGFGIISTYGQPWQDYYRERGLYKIDPVAKWASSAFKPFRWRDIDKITPLSRQQKAFLNKAEAAGLHHGIGVPFAGPRLQVAGIAMATSERRLSRTPNLDLLAAYCNHFYACYKRILGTTAAALPPLVTLSEREQQIMIRVAHGRTDPQIAQSLGLAPDTIDYYLRGVFRKLGVHNRVAAASICVQYGLIEL
jgi:DNA-binding CsgD family transcriptional regulator